MNIAGDKLIINYGVIPIAEYLFAIKREKAILAVKAKFGHKGISVNYFINPLLSSRFVYSQDKCLIS